MEAVQNVIAPLSPFSWMPAEEAVTPGSANAALHDIARLDLRFELVVEEFAIPFHHPLHRIYASHPLLRDTLTPRQLQLLQYGVVIHAEERLVLVAAPHCCGDAGACIAASYEQVFSRAMDSTSGIARHPLLPEYTFIVYRLPAAAAEAGAGWQASADSTPEALFRLVFRNVTPEQETQQVSKSLQPRYKLVAILTSSAAYYAELQRGIQYRNDWRANTAATRAYNPPLSAVASSSSVAAHATNDAVVPETIARGVRSASPLSKLCTSLARVLERFSAEETVAVDVDGNATAEAVDGDAGEAADDSVSQECSITHARDPWTYYYTREGPRLCGRIDVMERTPAVLRSWRDGQFALAEFEVTRVGTANAWGAAGDPHKSTHPLLSLTARSVPCARVLLLPWHRDVSTLFVDNEVSSFLPKGEACDDASGKPWGVVYASPAAERLRRWVLQGLVCAETHGVRAVLLELDPVDLLSPCVELLYDGTGGDEDARDDGEEGGDTRLSSQLRYRRALFLVCQVVMETVERFVRCSGLVWKVTVAAKELGGSAFAPATAGGEHAAAAVPVDAVAAASTSVLFTLWCREILNVIRSAAVTLETSSARNTLSFVEDSPSAGSGDGAAVATALVAATAEPGSAAAAGGGAGNALALVGEGSKQLVVCPKTGVEGALALFTGDAVGAAAPVPTYIVAQANAVGVKVSDDAMYPLFCALCTAVRQTSALPVSALVDLLLEEWTGGSSKWLHHSSSRLVCPLDSCGVPVNRARVQRFLLPFLEVMRGVPSATSDAAAAAVPTSPASSGTMNYAQFSMVMLAIAKM
ncbi:paraflagellar rod component [Novymonas esmeraldas]|uniref:Paraflagellar rod component n=1 Tax=Novymonas esmeraldas TaxID=1808958 RepID=A0AAW0F5M5_9TRYP